jgi:hypothetical protein
MSVGNKVRIYDLAKELKQDTKRVMEELRREGADVSVPSNSVSKEIADKVRNKYFPKKETAPARTIKVIKKVEKPVLEEAPAVVAEPPVVETPVPQVEEKKEKVITPALAKESVQTKPSTSVSRPMVRKKVIAPVAEPELIEETAPVSKTEEITPIVEAPVEAKTEEKTAAVETPVIEAQTEEKPEVAKTEGPKVFSPTGSTVTRKLRLTPEALKAGLKQGEKVVAAPQVQQKIERVQPSDRGRDRNSRPFGRNEGTGRPEMQGTPGENANPQKVYIPPADARKKLGRSVGKKGNDRRGGNDKSGGKFGFERDVVAPRPLMTRMLDQVGKVDPENLKPVRLIEGAKVRDFAEKLGIVPKYIVQLLIKRGILATLNQPIGEKIAVELGASFGFNVAFVPFEEMVIEQ